MQYDPEVKNEAIYLHVTDAGEQGGAKLVLPMVQKEINVKKKSNADGLMGSSY